MDLSGDIILENERVCLLPLTAAHLGELYYFSENEPGLWTYSLSRPVTLEKMESYIRFALEQRTRQEGYPFVVMDKRSNRIAGSTRYYELDFRNKSCSVGFTWYGKAFQGTGLNKNCKYLLLDYAFDHWEMERIQFRADAQNTRSIQAIRSLGCKAEGILRSHLAKPDGGRRDSIILSILRQEWIDGGKAALRGKTE